MLTTLGPGIFDWEAAGGGQSSRETSVLLHRATSARPTSLKPSQSNPCELDQPLEQPWDASGSWALASQGHTPPLRKGPPLQAEEPGQPKADLGVYF